jgi:hypothetical protein
MASGQLTLISTTMGTPFEIDTRGRILLIEDIDEQPYSIDRMLTDEAYYRAHQIEDNAYGDGCSAGRIVDLMLSRGWQLPPGSRAGHKPHVSFARETSDLVGRRDATAKNL